MPIYEAGSCFLKLVYISAELVYELVYGWCMAGVWLVHGWCMMTAMLKKI